MASFFHVPFAPSDFGAGLVLRVSRTSTGTNWNVAIPAPSGNLYAYTRDSDDLAKHVCDAIASATGLTVTRSHTWNSATGGRLRIQFSGTAVITLRWTHANTTFDGQWLGFDTSSDTSSEGATDNWAKAPWQPARWFRPPLVVWSFEMPRRQLQATQSRGGVVDWRAGTSEMTAFRPLLDLLPAPLVFDDATAQTLLSVLPDRVDDDPNLSLEAAMWRPLEDARRLPIRFTPDHTDLTDYLELQPDIENGGREFLEDMRGSISPLGAGTDEAANLYRVTLPLMKYIGP